MKTFYRIIQQLGPQEFEYIWFDDNAEARRFHKEHLDCCSKVRTINLSDPQRQMVVEEQIQIRKEMCSVKD
jgi:hypothetical protein